MAVLDFDAGEFRRAGQLVDSAGEALKMDLGADVPAVGGDEVSAAIMNNLNARRRWLAEHLRSGFTQAMAAADGMAETADGFVSEDEAAAGSYGVSGYGGGSGAPSGGVVQAGYSAPTSAPASSAMPDISGREGEALALSLETGAGPIPATTAAATLSTLTLRAQQTFAQLTAAKSSLLASGQSQAHAPLMMKLERATAWVEGVAGHAEALSAGYSEAVSSHATTSAGVGPSAGWRVLKTSYNEAVAENVATGGLAQERVNALWTALDNQQKQASAAASGYQSTGEAVSVPPGTLPDPGLSPNGSSAPGQDKKPGEDPRDGKDALDGKKGKNPLEDAAGGQGMQDMLGKAMGPLMQGMQGMGQNNPLQSLTQMGQQMGQQLSQQVSKLAQGKNPLSSPLKPASLAKAGGGKGAGGGGKGLGGGGGLKGGGPGASVHPASASTTPSTATGSPMAAKPGATVGGGGGMGGGMGMMPMGGRGAGGDKGQGVKNNYGAPLGDVEETGRPGSVPVSEPGDSPLSSAPVVEPSSKESVKDRLARRRRDSGIE